MFPEPLVTIRTYSTADEAQCDLTTLDAEGIVAYVRVGGHGRGGGASAWLNVAESDAERAVRIIGPGPVETAGDDVDDPDGDYACPRCRSTRSTALPPYFLYALIACVVILGALASRQLWAWLAAFAAAMFVLGRLETRAPHWRCMNCGQTWNQNAGLRRRDAARRNAPD